MTQHPPRRRLHLHVGLPKTGTTYLQGCLACKRAWFAERGFEPAPMVDGRGAHHPLAQLLQRQGAAAAADVLGQAAAAAPPGRGLIASSEIFCGVLSDAALARAFADALAPDFDVAIHITLRRQDQLRESAYAEVARLGRRLGPPDPAPRPQDARPMDGLYLDPALELRLKILADAFGEDALHVAVYHDRRRRSPLTLFCEQLGLEPPEPPRLTERYSNEALPRRKTLIIAPFEKPRRRYARMVHEAVRDSRAIEVDAAKTLLSPAERRGIVEAAREENQRIIDRYAPLDGDWLLEAPADDPDWFPAVPPRGAEYLSLWAELMRAALGDPGRRWSGRLRDAAALTALTVGAARKARRDRRGTSRPPRP